LQLRGALQREGVGRLLSDSFAASVATLLSLVFNSTAGYAFAKLRFAGRDRIFKTLLAALVIPAQVRDAAAVSHAEMARPGQYRTAASSCRQWREYSVFFSSTVCADNTR